MELILVVGYCPLDLGLFPGVHMMSTGLISRRITRVLSQSRTSSIGTPDLLLFLTSVSAIMIVFQLSYVIYISLCLPAFGYGGGERFDVDSSQGGHLDLCIIRIFGLF